MKKKNDWTYADIEPGDVLEFDIDFSPPGAVMIIGVMRYPVPFLTGDDPSFYICLTIMWLWGNDSGIQSIDVEEHLRILDDNTRIVIRASDAVRVL